MDAQRIFKIVLMDLATDNLKLESELEELVNYSSIDITQKTQKIKNILSQMVMIDASIAKFTSMVTNNNKLNTEDNGNNNM